ncbi:NUDIX hydrolase [Pseudoroseomonas deserti]|uniref:NUDIX hydrolase n=1 Tax=Teichococcus deserti TaxID=1817963 RepID=A0A1V2H8G3_9PROT|nr:NUDIX hydrolase [Pseudoroseomonas deserti]ONG58773.1 NUDIX hydrolase [Pseudoroseomonas deserti]
MAGHFHRVIPEGEDRERLTCADCGFINYENPKIVAGAVVVDGGRVLLCRRAIPPRSGFWTLPAGFMELGETVAEGAAREAFEEASARIAIEGILAVYSIARIGQVQILFRASLAEPGIAPGPESLETRFFAWEDIPWAEIAFPSVHWALHHWQATRHTPLGAPATNPPEDQRGMTPLPGTATSV